MKNIISVILLLCLFFTSCNKNDSSKYYITGEWKLAKVIILDTTIVDGHYQHFEVDYSENNIIYKFQKNNNLVVTSSNSQKNRYYKIEDTGSGCSTPYADLQIKIDEEYYLCRIPTMNIGDYQKDETMLIIGKSTNLKQIIDETDLVIMEQEPLSSWHKVFIKLK